MQDIMRIAGGLAALTITGAVQAGTNPTAVLFGTEYRVQRFTLHTSVTWPNPHPFALEPELAIDRKSVV